MAKGLMLIPVFLGIFVAPYAYAQSEETYKAKVLEVVEQRVEPIGGTTATARVQTLRAQLTSGPEEGTVITLENDHPAQLSAGDNFYVVKNPDSGQYSFVNPNRLPSLGLFVLLLVVLVSIIGGKQGIRGLVSLVASLLVIIYVLLPGILHGYSPILVSMAVASFIVILGSFITHGFNKMTLTAVLGMVITIVITGGLALVAIHFTFLTGFDSDEAVYLNVSGVTIDFAGLLLGGMLIGLLGVLYDASISQAVAIDEFRHLGPHLPRRSIFRRAMRVGREHIGALTNTLAIAYVGASLPLFLLFYSERSSDAWMVINGEMLSAEIIRIIIGSIGIVLAVPITSLISTMMLVKKTEASADVVAEEEKKLGELPHRH